MGNCAFIAVAARLQDKDKVTLTVLNPLLSQQPSRFLPHPPHQRLLWSHPTAQEKLNGIHKLLYVPDEKKNSA